MKSTTEIQSIGLSLFVGIVLICWATTASHSQKYAWGATATTTVSISVCGNGTVEGAEVCDDENNNGAYGASIALRSCNSSCSGFAPYAPLLFSSSHTSAPS